jgi:prepilin-type N-terminal cleavage/methylation domain-containing protein
MRKKSGFSLVEIIVSAVVFSLVITGLISVFISGNKLVIHIRERMTSVQLGKLFLDPLQVYVRQDTWGSNDLSINGINKPGGSQIINNRTFTENHSVSTVAGTGLQRVTSTISWVQ